jgi:hypothetical protein
MFTFQLAERLKIPVTCFCTRVKDDVSNESMPSVSLMTADLSLRLSNLTPNTDNVKAWNIFVIGRDGHYLLTSMPLGSPWRKLFTVDVLDTNGNKLEPAVKKFMDEIWNSVRDSTQAMLYATLGDDIFFMNVHVIQSIENEVIGAVAFARPLADILKEMKSVRASIDRVIRTDVAESKLFSENNVL